MLACAPWLAHIGHSECWALGSTPGALQWAGVHVWLQTGKCPTKLVWQKFEAKLEFQCIVISLKDIFYEVRSNFCVYFCEHFHGKRQSIINPCHPHQQQADSLVGICRDAGTNSSRTLTLDLSQFDDGEGGEA